MFRLSRLVWRDAASRYGSGLVVACIPAVYLWREWPPWAVRDALWNLEPRSLCLAAALLGVAYGLMSFGPTRQLVASNRLVYWRQQPISPKAWRVFHGVHLLLLHTPGVLALGYVLAPGGPWLSCGAPVLLAAVAIGPVAWQFGHPVRERGARSLRLPRVRDNATALTRLLLLAMLRRRLVPLSALGAASLGVGTLGRIAISRTLQAADPAEATACGFAAVVASLGAVSVWIAWPLVRREQWWLDSMGVTAGNQRAASVVLASATSGPGLLVLLTAATELGPFALAGMVVVATTTLVWVGAATLWVDADGVVQRMPERRRGGRFALVLLLPLPAALMHPAALVVPALLAWLRSARAASRAMQVRQRFEIDDVTDDHEGRS